MNNLKQLEQAVEAYMQQNNIKPKHKEKLMESILLWTTMNKSSGNGRVTNIRTALRNI